jgi:hypothetical protein
MLNPLHSALLPRRRNLLAPNKPVEQTFTIHVDGDNVAVIPVLHRVKPIGNSGHSEIDLSPLSPSSIPLTIQSSIPLGKPYNLTSNTFSLTLTLEAATLDIAQDVYLALVIQIVPQNPVSVSLLHSPGISASSSPQSTHGVMPIGLEIQNFDLPYVHDTWLPLPSP